MYNKSFLFQTIFILLFAFLPSINAFSDAKGFSYYKKGKNNNIKNIGVLENNKAFWQPLHYKLSKSSKIIHPNTFLKSSNVYEAYIPNSYNNNKKYGLLVYVNGCVGGGYDVFEKNNMIVICSKPKNSIETSSGEYLVGLVMSGMLRFLELFNIDRNRIYITGTSWGGRLASSIAYAFPEYFKGTMPNCGSSYFKKIPNSLSDIDYAYPKDLPYQFNSGVYTLLKKNKQKHAFITNFKDGRYPYMFLIHNEGFEKEIISKSRPIIYYDGKSHCDMRIEQTEEAISFLDHRFLKSTYENFFSKNTSEYFGENISVNNGLTFNKKGYLIFKRPIFWKDLKGTIIRTEIDNIKENNGISFSFHEKTSNSLKKINPNINNINDIKLELKKTNNKVYIKVYTHTSGINKNKIFEGFFDELNINSIKLKFSIWKNELRIETNKKIKKTGSINGVYTTYYKKAIYINWDKVKKNIWQNSWKQGGYMSISSRAKNSFRVKNYYVYVDKVLNKDNIEPNPPSPPNVIKNVTVCKNQKYTLPTGKLLTTITNKQKEEFYKDGVKYIYTFWVSNNCVYDNYFVCKGNTHTYKDGFKEVISKNKSRKYYYNNINYNTSIKLKKDCSVSEIINMNICKGQNFVLNGKVIKNIKNNQKEETVINGKKYTYVFHVSNYCVYENFMVCKGEKVVFRDGYIVNNLSKFIERKYYVNGIKYITKFMLDSSCKTNYYKVCKGKNIAFSDGYINKNVSVSFSRKFKYKNINYFEQVEVINCSNNYRTVNLDLCYGKNITLTNGKVIKNITKNKTIYDNANKLIYNITVRYNKETKIKVNLNKGDYYYYFGNKKYFITKNTTFIEKQKTSYGCDSTVKHIIYIKKNPEIENVTNKNINLCNKKDTIINIYGKKYHYKGRNIRDSIYVTIGNTKILVAIVNIKNSSYFPKVKIKNNNIFIENPEGYKIEWKSCNSDNILFRGNYFIPDFSGAYYASLYSSNCVVNTKCIRYNYFGDKEMIYYPNPVVDNILTIEFDKEIDIANIFVYNQYGLLLVQKNIINAKQTQINFSSFPRGIYFVKIRSKEKTKEIKIIKWMLKLGIVSNYLNKILL